MLDTNRETQGDGKESPEEESLGTGASSDTSAQTRSQKVMKEEAAFCAVSMCVLCDISFTGFFFCFLFFQDDKVQQGLHRSEPTCRGQFDCTGL